MERVEYRSRGLCALCSDEHLQGLSGHERNRSYCDDFGFCEFEQVTALLRSLSEDLWMRGFGHRPEALADSSGLEEVSRYCVSPSADSEEMH